MRYLILLLALLCLAAPASACDYGVQQFVVPQAVYQPFAVQQYAAPVVVPNYYAPTLQLGYSSPVLSYGVSSYSAPVFAQSFYAQPVLAPQVVVVRRSRLVFPLSIRGF